MALTTEELNAKITESVKLLERWNILWEQLIGEREDQKADQAYQDAEAVEREAFATHSGFTAIHAETKTYIKSLES